MADQQPGAEHPVAEVPGGDPEPRAEPGTTDPTRSGRAEQTAADPTRAEQTATAATRTAATRADATRADATRADATRAAATRAEPETAGGRGDDRGTTAAGRDATHRPAPDGTDGDPDDEPTGTIVARWSGSAAIPPPTPRRRLWGLLPPKPPLPAAAPVRSAPGRAVAEPLDPTRAEVTRRQPVRLDRTATLPDPDEVREAASRPGHAAAGYPQQERDWENTPPVDPWADHDTVWQADPGAPPMPPTLIGPAAVSYPPTLFDRGTAVPPSPAPPNAGQPPSAQAQSVQAQSAQAQSAQRPTAQPYAPWPLAGLPPVVASGTPPPPVAAPPVAPPPLAPAPSWRSRLFTRPSSTGPSSTGSPKPITSNPGRSASSAPPRSAGAGGASAAPAAWTPPVWAPVPQPGTQPAQPAAAAPRPSRWALRAKPARSAPPPPGSTGPYSNGSAVAPEPDSRGWRSPGWPQPPARQASPGRPAPSSRQPQPGVPGHPAPSVQPTPQGRPGRKGRSGKDGQVEPARAPKPPKLTRAERKARRSGALPPPWSPPPVGPPTAGPPAGGPPTSGKSARPRRRRRRWPKALLALAVLGGAAFAAPSYFGVPYLGQYPVSATLPYEVVDLHLRDDASSHKVAERLTQSLRDADVAGAEVFAGVYGDDNGKRVTLFGTTGFRLTPQSDVEAEMRRLTGEYDITDIEPYDLWETGAHERCGTGRSGRTSVVVCSWADHGSMATVLLTRRSTADSAELVAILRTEILSRG